MINKIVLSTIAASVLVTTSLSAGSLEDRIEKLEAIIMNMQKSNSNLEKTIVKIKAAKEDKEERVSEVEERLDDVEFRSYTDKLSFGVGMRVESNNYSNELTDGSKFSATVNRVKLNLNMKAKITDDMKFVGKLSMYKNFGDQTERDYNNDYAQGRRPMDSTVYAERAYVDWLMNSGSKVPFTLSLGRLSTSDGPSYNFKENTKRKGTFSALAYDWAVDGAIATANLDNFVSGLDVQYTYFTPSVTDASSGIAQIGDDTFEDTTVNGLIVNKTFKELSFGNELQLFHMKAADTTARTGIDTANMGDVAITGMMIEAKKINGNIDLFAHYAKSEAKPSGNMIQIDANGDGVYTAGAEPMMGMLQTNTGAGISTDSLSGNAFWVGTRYHINKDWKIGAEFNKGSKNWFSYTTGSNDPVNKLAVRGTAKEIYVTKSINKYANFRLGYIGINFDYTNSGMLIGTPWAINSPQAVAMSAMGAVKKTSNAYLTFNLLF